jgi:hypothetical protein
MPCYPPETMEGPVFHVQADWDPEAEVWVATSEDVPGLATEAPTVEALAEKLRAMIPELLEANRVVPVGQADAIAFELTSHRQEKVRLAS